MSDERPAALSFRMPAEWEPHAATWLTWPHNRDSWPGAFDPIPDVWVEIVAALSPHEAVHVLVDDGEARADAAARLERCGVSLGNVFFHLIRSNDAWMRDHGPTFVVHRSSAKVELAAVDWIYNAWGDKYPWEHDARIAAQVAELLGVRAFAPGIVLEGGSIDVNGRGTVLTTESCLLNPNRNPGLSRSQLEQILGDYLGARHVLWLGDGIAGDDTDGHIDDLARFTDPATVVTVVESDPADENYERLRDNHHRLLSMKDQDGQPLRIVTLPMPRPLRRDGQRLPASYANFYIANGVVLVPTFGDPNDATALATLQELFPGRRVVGLAATDLVWGLGAFHCVTQQQPAV